MKSVFQKDVKIQDFFVSATVEGVNRLLYPKTSGQSIASGNDPANDKVQLLNLYEGNTENDCIIFINPAGTSSLCYLDLVKQISNCTNLAIYALDDGIISSGGSMDFDSITEVARDCIVVLTKKASLLRTKKIHVIGWSYGGIVALEVARQLNDVSLVVVASVILIDSPINNNSNNNTSSKLENQDDDHYGLDSLTRDVPQLELRDRIKQHFKDCTMLINKYNSTLLANNGLYLTCPIIDIRPLEDSNFCNMQVIRDLTSAEVQRFTVSGSHWTMIFNNFAENVAKIIVQTIDKT